MAKTSRKAATSAARTPEIVPEPATEPAAVQGASEDRTEKPVRTLTFFERLKRVHADDWGTRANVYLYRLEPITDRLKGGNSFVFVMKYDEPIDQDKVLMDQGSGKYRAVFTFKKPGEDTADQVDNTIFEMLNTSFPPKIPPGEWVNDPRNRKWAWARPAGAPGPNGEAPTRPVDDTVEKFRLFNDMRSAVAEEIKTAQPAAAADPFSNGLNIATQILQMRSDNPMVDIMRDELKDMRAEMRAERERSERLQEELRAKAATPPQSSGLGTLTSIIGEVKGLLPDLKEMFPGLAEKAGTVARAARSNMTGDQEFWQPIVNRIVEAVTPAVPLFVSKLMTSSNGQQPAPAPTLLQPAAAGMQPPPTTPPGAPPTTGPEPQPFNPQQAFAFLKAHAKPFLDWFKDGMPGGEFAESIFNLYGADWQGLPWLHAKQTFGAENIVAAFKGSPLWPEIANMEPAFITFVADFVKWQPGQEEPAGETVDATVEAN
jgi:hypothetical protein